MKTKFTNRELVHIWAAQKQERGTGSNMFFSGPVIYSYGTHFPIAKIHPGNVVLFTVNTYSVTTAKHKSYARAAISYMTEFNVPNVLAESAEDHAYNARAILMDYQEAHDAALRATRNSETHAERARVYAKAAFDYCFEFSQVSGDIKRAARRAANTPFNKRELATLAAKRERARANEETAQARAEARMAAELEEARPYLERWAAGENVTAYWSHFRRLPCRLRVVDCPDAIGDKWTIETSHGASVPLSAAILLLGAWQAGTLEPGQQIGPYEVHAWTPDMIKIGCHTITREEAERVIVPAASKR